MNRITSKDRVFFDKHCAYNRSKSQCLTRCGSSCCSRSRYSSGRGDGRGHSRGGSNGSRCGGGGGGSRSDGSYCSGDCNVKRIQMTPKPILEIWPEGQACPSRKLPSGQKHAKLYELLLWLPKDVGDNSEQVLFGWLPQIFGRLHIPIAAV